jgi:poly-gamma-glutamate capsule biosynthesis protein CapA/YwtB (metallophosphatase superfamily)
MRKTINKIIFLNIPLFIIIGLVYWKVFLIDNKIKGPKNIAITYNSEENKLSNIQINSDNLETRHTIVEKLVTEEAISDIIVPEYKDKIEISFLWDVMIGWRVKNTIEKHWQAYAFSGTSDYLSKQDAVIFNLETPVTDWWKKFNKKYIFNANKDHLKWLKTFNDNLYANLANNHFWDYWVEWMKNTFKNLTDNWIEYFWAGNNEIEANTIKIIEIEGVKLWLIAQVCIWPVQFIATKEKSWHAGFNKDEILQQIKSAKEKWVDIIVYNMHCWDEYKNWPNSKQIDYAHFAIDSWVDLVIWHHPHWYQPIEIYKEKLIFYSLWNYIFDIFRWRRTQEGIIANIIIEDKKITWAVIVPVYTEWYWNTIISDSKKASFALDELYEISKKLWDIEGIKEGYINLINY